MVDPSYLHLYEQLSLGTAGLVMGLALVAGHGYALLHPQSCKDWLARAHKNAGAAKFLLAVDFLWLLLLLLDASWNPFSINMFEFNSMRGLLMILSILVWVALHRHAKELLFPRALGLFLLMLATVPLTAAFLKEPATRLLIPIWWYPVLTVAMFWVGKPYLFRDWMAGLARRPQLYTALNGFGLLYGLAVLACAIAFWY